LEKQVDRVCPASGPRYQGFRGGRASLRAGAAAGLAVAALLAADVANAQFFRPNYGFFGSPFYGSPDWFRPRPAAPANPYYFKPKRKRVDAPRERTRETTRETRETTRQTRETAKKEPKVTPPAGPLLVAIALNSQRLTLYSKGAAVAHSPVSTGTASHPTPTGIFSVIGKERFHRSNLYSNAPMPFMQRITWSGVALHQGVLPGYPASHGCIRLPGQFAQYLWGTTRMGARVIITRDEVAPFEIAHAKLFAPRPEQPPADQLQAVRSTRIAETDPATSYDALKPAALVTAEHQSLAAKPTAAPGAPGADSTGGSMVPAGSSRRSAAAGSSDVVDVRAPSPTTTDGATAGAAADNAIKGGRPATTEVKDIPRMSEPVSVFISRKAGRLYVRQAFEPLFDVPVTIRDPDVPLGTHLYTATDVKDDGSAMRWVAVNLSADAGLASAVIEPERRRGKKAREEHERTHERTPHVPASARQAAAAALDRVDLPKGAVDRISDLLSPGASLIISDLPISNETGKYTDFIILTK
jgi:lipoprotein-anchoring transpeptidase ErfK/SrfK